jgi:hypothetical protein
MNLFTEGDGAVEICAELTFPFDIATTGTELGVAADVSFTGGTAGKR